MRETDWVSCRDLPVAKWRGLSRDQSGHALIEAALIFPILLGLFLGVSEFSEALTVNRRLQGAAHTTADLVARLQSVTGQDLDGIKTMIDETMKPYSIATLGIVVTSVVVGTDGVTTIVDWSDTRGAGVSPHVAGSPLELPTGLVPIQSSLILAEVKYSFQSTLATMIAGTVPLHTKAYQRPRLVPKISN